MQRWLSEPMAKDVSLALERLARAPGVRRIAVMPDVHLAEHVCVGTVLATDGVVYPQAVGGDIGCGMATLRLDMPREALTAARAEQLFGALRLRVPAVRQRSPQDIGVLEMSDIRLQRRVSRDARVQLGTVGRGNHFVELQADEGGCLWLAVHSGSRALGPSIREHHIRRAVSGTKGLVGLTGDAVADYLVDHNAAQEYACANRRAIAVAALRALEEVIDARGDWSTWFDVTHNFVREESHDGQQLWVHRKGACSAAIGEPGIIPGSMGSATYHVDGRGCAAAMCSSSHGAGRRLARGEAMRRITVRELANDLEGVYYEEGQAHRLRDEAPAAYKDIDKVMRAQKELVRITRRLAPVLSYKST
ncbi:MAG: RtcB family protein [Planctomycetota bacterium]|nr:RtcB family protein [Planctomycetota bacterium]